MTQVAEHLGVHYMTAYRYVRTGRLHAAKHGREWLVDPADLLAFEHALTTEPRRGGRRAAYPAELEDRLLDADETGSWHIVEQALASGMAPEATLMDVIVPAMVAVGEDWASGRITVAREHQASATASRLIGRLGPQFARRGRKRGRIVVGAPPGDNHGLPTAIVRDLLRGRGFEVIDLSANVPAESWTTTVADLLADDAGGIIAVGVCATTPDNEANIAAAVAAIRGAGTVPVVLGGYGVRDADAARRLGADAYSASAPAALELVERLADGGPAD